MYACALCRSSIPKSQRRFASIPSLYRGSSSQLWLQTLKTSPTFPSFTSSILSNAEQLDENNSRKR